MEGVKNFSLAVKEERITHRKKYNEFVMTRLRTAEGFSREALEQQTSNQNIRRHFERAAEHLLQQGLLVEYERYIKIPPQKWFVSDGIITKLMV
jgi:oxygen-independent coproporphyrinogen-3 oxidase